jgi:AcrR family transcriptional regulator
VRTAEATGTAGRRRLSADQRREQLADAAVAVVASQGYRGTTADAIAKRAGVSKGLLWHYFSDRDDLLEFTAQRTLVKLRETVAADVDLAQPVPQLLRDAIHRVTGLRATHRAELKAMHEIVLNLRTADGTPRLDLAQYDETYAQQEAIFRRGQAEGDFRRTLDPRYMAATYQGAVDTMLDYLDTHPDADPDQYATALADILLDGLRPR